ncbi:hypothetical protein COY62_02180 [bacterium (Candidatus Howlettbacteria) CG_4_10_14_0_8_um_filter_40_9]|nr:MAG: hypothetical protein COY62_02180 [bacterium (Candidatus Howlettbacteria) CG_4_10_14_0_8_um_filter_40_9]
MIPESFLEHILTRRFFILEHFFQSGFSPYHFTRKNPHPLDENFFLVDQSLKFWNTFCEIALEWEPTLKIIYDAQNINNTS